MRKFAPVLAAAVVCLIASPAVCAAGEGDGPEAGAKPPFKVSGGVSRFVQTYSGLNWVTNRALSTAASAYLSVKTHGRVHAKVRAYGFTDAFVGRFKSVDVRASGGKLRGVPFGDVHISSNTPFQLRYFKHKGRNAGFRAPVLIIVEGQIPKRDLSAALKSQRVTDGLRFLKFDIPGLGQQRLTLLEPHVDFTGDEIGIDSYLLPAGAPKEQAVKLKVLGRVLLDQERYIKLTDMQVESNAIDSPQNFGEFAEKLFNPLVDFGRYDRLTHAFRLSKLSVGDDRVTYSGRLILAPKPPVAKTP